MPLHGYPGNIITANPTAPTSSVASGVWTTEQQLQAKAAGNWPFTIPTQQISRSLRFNSADSAYLTRTPASAGNRKTWTWSGWVKRSALSSDNWLMTQAAGSGLVNDGFFLSSGLSFYWNFQGAGGGVDTSAVFRDASAWYHIVVKFDTTQATSTNRIIFYVNGVQQAQTGSYPAQNYDGYINSAAATDIGRLNGSTYFNGYMTEVNFIDGQALTPSSFGQTNASTGVWEPIAYTGTYGTNGFYVNFSDNSGTTSTTLGKDYSGNGNNWTPNNFSVTAGAGNDSLTDTPTAYGTDTGVGGELRGNFCTLNPIGPGAGTIANGSLQFTAQDNYGRLCTFGLSTGKWYWESTATATEYFICGLISQAASYGSLYDGTQASGYNDGGGYPGPCYGINISGGGTSYKVDQTTATTYGPQVAPVNGDVFMFAVDFDAGKFWVGKNGTWMASGDPVAGTNATWSSMTATTYFVGVHGYGTPTQYLNFGQRPFAYTAPSGFKCMAVQNFSTPTIGATSTTQANDYMNVVLYTGTGSSQVVSGLDFTTDFWWQKARNSAENHYLQDAVRGFGASKSLSSNTTGYEGYNGTPLTQSLSVSSTGFTVNGSDFNANTTTYVAWCWNAGGSTVTNTSGTISAQVRANTTSGFSIVAYTGNGSTSSTQTVGHGLGVKPAFIITKYRSGSPPAGGDRWSCWHQDLGGTNAGIFLDLANARNNGMWAGQASISSTVFVPADLGYNNVNGATYINYVFAPVAGYSAFGSYTGNASTDGPFVYLGFRPRFIMIKAASNSANWVMFDSARSPYNDGPSAMPVLYPNLSAVEDGAYPATPMDFLSNGFKLRISNAGYNLNDSGYTFIYAAFAESPFKYSLAR